MNHKYIFITVPNACGSTLWEYLLATSPNASKLPNEGHNVKGVAGNIPRQGTGQWALHTGDVMNSSAYPWDMIKRIWHDLWDMNKMVLIEKSPPNVIRANLLQYQFVPSKFLLSIRDPYVFSESMTWRFKQKYNVKENAENWVAIARYQMENEKRLKDWLLIRYEDLADDPVAACDKVIEWCPELETLDADKVFQIRKRKSSITNMNNEYLKRLSNEQVKTITAVLEKSTDVLEHYKYELRY
jgi:hypothetical protein